MIEMNDRDGEWIQRVYTLRQRHKWLLVTLGIVTVLMLFFMYQMLKRENLINTYHYSVIRQGSYEIHQAKQDLKQALDHDYPQKTLLVTSALEHIEDTLQIFRMPHAYYNFKMTGKTEIIGNGAATEYFNHYIYLINDWLWDYEQEGLELDDLAIENMIVDLEAFTGAYMFHESTQGKPSIESMDYDQLQDHFWDLLKAAESEFTYESFLYPLD